MSPTRQQRRAAERLERPCVGHLEPGLRGAATAWIGVVLPLWDEGASPLDV